MGLTQDNDMIQALAADRSDQPFGEANLPGRGWRTENGAVTSAVLVHLRVESAHFDWRWRERPALALLAWEALTRDPVKRLRRIQVESTGTTINFRPAAITHRDLAASALLIASGLALTAAVGAFKRHWYFLDSPRLRTRTGTATARAL